VSIFWVTLEDSAKDILNHYLSYKLFIKAKDIRYKRFNGNAFEKIKEHVDRFKTFDVDFVEQAGKINNIRNAFRNFCMYRKNRFNIIIIDNLLSLDDRDEFKNNDNSMYDYMMSEVLKLRQQTGALVIPIHHYKDSQQYRDKKENGYRPILSDMKGTEGFRRIPNQVLLLNKPGLYDDLATEYTDRADVFHKMFICDTGKNREDESRDEVALIHLFANLNCNWFAEIE
jgi:KaiC/GvpD/RAD55 family RecA-like ATPase